MGYSTSTEEAAKSLYDISSLIRNDVNGQEAFHSENGSAMPILTSEYGHKIDWRLTTSPVLQHILVSNSVEVRLQKKVMFLTVDLVDFQLNYIKEQLPFVSCRLFLKSIVDIL
jgi:hsp70-interacting protein